MSLAPGKRFGVYELLSPIGAGGMGEVYRAHDSRLGRDVAIKILPPGFAGNTELLSRFDREAKAIASLNHPHICTVHDVGHEDGVHYLVMELIDGESLAQRLLRGPLPVEQVLRYGAEIATALDAAHRKGITHRDLKPGNVMITKSGAKLLDFGLAKAAGEERGVIEGLASGLTEARPLTAEGTILGTFQYMAPEQLEGSPADARTDIFALGTLLYEMATAKRAFEGSNKTSLIAAIVSAQPAPIAEVVPMTPPALDHVVRKCLEKDPDERWQSAHDVASELRWISEAGSQIGLPAAAVRARRSQKVRVTTLAIVGWVAAITALGLFYRERTTTASARDLFRSDLVLPSGQGIAGPVNGGMEFSPDGTRLLLVQRSDGIAIHDFRSGNRHVLDGTRGGNFPFWSSDGEWFAFFADGKLKKIRSSGGPVQILCDAAQGRGGSWSRKGIIVFAPEIFGPLMQVPESGGTPAPATTTDAEEWTHRNPRFLPDGDHFLFTATSRADGGGDMGAIAVASLSDPNVRMLDVSGAQPQYADGYLFYVSDRNLIARQFDAGRVKVTGSPQPIADRVDVFLPRQTAHLSVSSTGVLAYQQRFSSPAQLFWTDRSGRETLSAGEPGNYGGARASGDGKTAVLLRREDSDEVSVWLMDLSRGNVTRVTRSFDSPVVYATPSYDGRQVAVSTLGGTALKPGVWIQTPSVTAMPDLLLEMSPFLIADWSHDGRVMVAHTQRTGTGFDIIWIAVDDPTTVNYFAPSAANEWDARLSPDGRWLAYSSNETGSNETYISDFPEAKQRWQVTRTGNSHPIAWSADGSELFYGGSAGSAAVTVRENGGNLEIGDPTPIPHSEDSYVLWGDRDRFLIRKELDAAIEEPIRIVRNWKALLEK
ncbi:MAG TPA: protein kinase [Rhodothermales bacterium]|nr:protein kinase [Rhodothermales bacterium]